MEMNCPACASPNAEGATTCRECGRPLPVHQAYAQPPQTTNSTAVASLVCGILGWTVLPVIGAILAIVLGHMAKNEIQRSGGRTGGDGLATAGLVLGYASFGLAALGIVLTLLGVAIPLGLIGCGLCTGL